MVLHSGRVFVLNVRQWFRCPFCVVASLSPPQFIAECVSDSLVDIFLVRKSQSCPSNPSGSHESHRSSRHLYPPESSDISPRWVCVGRLNLQSTAKISVAKSGIGFISFWVVRCDIVAVSGDSCGRCW